MDCQRYTPHISYLARYRDDTVQIMYTYIYIYMNKPLEPSEGELSLPNKAYITRQTSPNSPS